MSNVKNPGGVCEIGQIAINEACEVLDSRRVPITFSNRIAGPYPYYGANGVQDYVSDYIFDDELVLLAEDGGHFGSKERPIAYRVSGKCWVNNHAHVLKPKPGIDVDYLCYSLMFYDVSRFVNGATRQKLTQADMRKMVIPLYSCEDQHVIVSILDKVFEKIRGLETIQSTLDNLVKSRFVEMFGDIESKGQDQLVELRTLLRKPASNGFFAKRKDYVEDGNVSVLGVVNVVNRMYSGIDDLPRTNASEKDINKYSLSYGDMLFCRSSLVLEGIGKASVVPPDVGENTLFECHVIRLPLDTDICVPEFVQVQSSMPAFRKQMMAKAKTATMTTIDQKSILGAKVFLPSIEQQKAYLAFIKQVDKSKVAVQKAIEKLELLKASLMQEYFG